jgi:hypothetical protein
MLMLVLMQLQISRAGAGRRRRQGRRDVSLQAARGIQAGDAPSIVFVSSRVRGQIDTYIQRGWEGGFLAGPYPAPHDARPGCAPRLRALVVVEMMEEIQYGRIVYPAIDT